VAVFIKLVRRGMNNSDLGEVAFNADSIVKMERDDEYHQTYVTLKDGVNFAVSESVDRILDLLEGR
jgi:hypothetical protein